MRETFFTIFLIIGSLAKGYSQITVDASSFPLPGDSLVTCTDNLPGSIYLLGPGGPHTWDFSQLQAPFARRSVIQTPSAGKDSEQFPDATYLAEPPQVGGQGYYKVTSDRLEWLGYTGPAPEELDLELTLKFDQPDVVRWAPLNYQDNRDHRFSFTFAFPFDVIDPIIPDTLPIQPDSFRITFEIERSYEVDAWGEMLLPDGSYPVLREKRVEIQKPKAEIYLPLLEWVTLNENLLPDPFSQPDTIRSFHFFNDTAKEPIAVVQLDETGEIPLSVEYKSRGIITDVREDPAPQPGVVAYPNPAITRIRFDFSDLKADNYTLTIFNVLGQPLWRKTYRISGSTTEKVNLSRFKRGTYLYSLEDSTGKVISARRFIIIRP